MKRIIIKILLSVALVFTPLLVHANAPSAKDSASVYGTNTSYSIFRKGKKIGNHALTISDNGDNITIKVESNIVIRILKVPVFKFNYVSTERWQNNRLISVDSTTTTDKEVETATLMNKADKASISSNGQMTSIDKPIQFATNHWHVGATTQSNLFNTIKGTNSQVSVKAIESETITINDKTLNTTQYQYTGEIIAQSWYDENNRWVKLAFLGSDGSEISYLIDKP